MDKVVARFEGDLAEIVRHLEFIRASFKLVPRAGEILEQVAASNTLRPMMIDFHSQKLTDANLFHQGLYVQLCAAFEWFMRNLVIAYVDELGRIAPTYASLATRKGQPILRNFYHSGAALQQVFKNPSNMKLDYELIAKNVGTTFPESPRVALNSNTFALYIGTLDSDEIENTVKRIGIDESFWVEISRAPDLRKLLGESRGVDVKKSVKAFINDFMKRRNNIAHKGDAIQQVTENDVKQTAEFLKIFARGLTEIAKKNCKP